MLRALPVLRLAYLRLGMLIHFCIRSHAVLRHAAVGIHLCISLLHVLGWALCEGLCARLFWLKDGMQA